VSAREDDIQLLVDVVSTPSLSGHELAASRVFAAAAAGRGFSTEIDAQHSVLAHRGATENDADVHIMLLGHIDTVPGDIPVRLEDGVLHARGSVDAKGPLCAMLAAATRAEIPAGVRLSVVGAAGEEADSPGARAVRERFSPDACVIGEPSGWDGVTLGYKGRLLVAASCACPSAHSAGPEESASDRLISWWNLVHDEIVSDTLGGRVFDSLQATVHAMSSDADGLTQRARLAVGFRLPPAITPETLSERLRALAGDDITLEIDGGERAHATDRNDPVVRALSAAVREAGGRPRPKLKTGTADLNVVGPAWGCPIAAYGPGDSALDHTPDERLEIGEYARSIDVLTTAIESLAAELADGESPS